MNPERYEALKEEVDKLVNNGFIREVHYPRWVSNPVLVIKPNGNWRTCVDFSDLNKACPKDGFPLPRVDQMVDATTGHEMLSFMDAYSRYNQIPMHPADEEHTYFITDRGLYCYKVMPFGLKNAGATYQRLVNKMFAQQIGKTMEVYVDDMLVKSARASHHVNHLGEMFGILRKYRMKLNPQKCAFGVGSGKFLGFMVSNRGIEANPEKIKALQDMRSPTKPKEVQKLTGCVAALNRFISKATDKCVPFFDALRGNKHFEWTPQCDEAFQKLKEHLDKPPILSKPNDDEELSLYLSVSQHAVSSVLIKEEGKVQLPIYYVSKRLLDAESRYSEMERLALALMIASRKLRHYFQSHTIRVLTNHPLRQVLQKPETSGRLLKWSVELSQFDIKYMPRIAIKGQALADFLAEFSHRPTYTPSEETEIARWKLYIPRAENANADALAKLASSKDADTLGVVPIEELERPTIEERAEAFSVPEGEDWITPLIRYLMDAQLPNSKNEARRIRYRAARYLLYDGLLYRRGYSTPLQRCLDDAEAQKVLQEIHEGICGNHSGGQSLALKVLRQGYYWPKLKKDAFQYARRYDKCQRYATIPRAPPEKLTSVPSPWPFTKWGIDLIGPLHPAPGGLKFAIAAVDYYTKWAEAKALTTTTEAACTKFMWDHIVCRFGVPHSIVSDNEKQFDNAATRRFCDGLGIRKDFSAPIHPQSNGQVEAINKILKHTLKKRLDDLKGRWAEELPKVL
ncbi:uncharacterized protein K02A2.6-like [Morus notabilis]|uniref:uncharacterized protein K02A2.6-like n=1 Tax=Morus notabilis TaxID=981085 RepID=UPI000CED1E80|nr:uncharacterized protein K02A2.6-like [Morus notabilis]